MNDKDILLLAINSKYIHPAMGAYQLIANTNHNINFIEFTIKDSNDNILEYITSLNVKIMAISVYIWNISKVKELLSFIDIPVILGGPEASFRYNELFGIDCVKYIIKGEGEVSFDLLLDFITNNTSIQNIPNLYYKDGNNIFYTFTLLPDLSKVKHDYTLIKDYTNRVCYVESSRGCYFNCSYCLASTEKPVRFFPIDEVKSNLLFLLNNNAKIIKFLDRSFNVNQKYMIEILSFIKEHDNGITSFQVEIVGDKLSLSSIELLNLMRHKAIRLEIGIQTTNKKTTEAILRKQDFELLKSNIEAIKDNVVIHTDLIAGLPFEDLNSFKNSFNQTFLLFTEELQLGFLKELQGTHISIHKADHGYVFSNTAPYEVICNNYITSSELDEVRFVEKAVDRLYNKGLYPRLMNYLFKDLLLDPFDIFNLIGKNIDSSMDLAKLAKAIYLTLKDIVDGEYLLYLIKQDYLAKDNIKPKIWWDTNITRSERNEIIEQFVNTFSELTHDQLYRYSKIEKYKNQYYLILYKPKKEYYLEYNYGFN